MKEFTPLHTSTQHTNINTIYTVARSQLRELTRHRQGTRAGGTDISHTKAGQSYPLTQIHATGQADGRVFDSSRLHRHTIHRIQGDQGRREHKHTYVTDRDKTNKHSKPRDSRLVTVPTTYKLSRRSKRQRYMLLFFPFLRFRTFIRI